jgi:hypothetical protein
MEHMSQVCLAICDRCYLMSFWIYMRLGELSLEYTTGSRSGRCDWMLYEKVTVCVHIRCIAPMRKHEYCPRPWRPRRPDSGKLSGTDLLYDEHGKAFVFTADELYERLYPEGLGTSYGYASLERCSPCKDPIGFLATQVV